MNRLNAGAALAPKIRAHLKAAVVRLAVWGLLSTAAADWIIKRGGLRDA